MTKKKNVKSSCMDYGAFKNSEQIKRSNQCSMLSSRIRIGKLRFCESETRNRRLYDSRLWCPSLVGIGIVYYFKAVVKTSHPLERSNKIKFHFQFTQIFWVIKVKMGAKELLLNNQHNKLKYQPIQVNNIFFSRINHSLSKKKN